MTDTTAATQPAGAGYIDFCAELENLRARVAEMEGATCGSVYGGFRCNVGQDPRAPHTWHAAVIEGVVASRWRD